MKSKKNNTGTDIKISAIGIRQQEGGFLGSLLPTLARVGSMALPYISKAVAPLATGALSGLANIGVNKIFNTGSGLFSAPQDKVDKLIAYKSYLTANQKKQIVSSLQNGSGFNLRLSKKQQEGGFLGSLLASLAIPMIIKAVTGKGLQVDPHSNSNTQNVYIPPKSKGGYINSLQQPSPFYGQCNSTQGYGNLKKGQEAKGLLFEKNSPFQSIPILGQIF